MYVEKYVGKILYLILGVKHAGASYTRSFTEDPGLPPRWTALLSLSPNELRLIDLCLVSANSTKFFSTSVGNKQQYSIKKQEKNKAKGDYLRLRFG